MKVVGYESGGRSLGLTPWEERNVAEGIAAVYRHKEICAEDFRDLGD